MLPSMPADNFLAGFLGWQVQENAEVARNVMRLELVYEVRKSEFNSNWSRDGCVDTTQCWKVVIPSFLTLLQAEVAKIVKKQEKQPKAVCIPDGFLTMT